jgi:hypothetical protein
MEKVDLPNRSCRRSNTPLGAIDYFVISAGFGAFAVDIPEGAELLSSLDDGQSLTVTLTDYAGTEHRFAFELNTVSGLRSQLETVCHSSVTSTQANRR